MQEASKKLWSEAFGLYGLRDAGTLLDVRRLMVNARIDRCVFGAFDPKGAAAGTLFDVSSDPRLNHEFAVSGGVLQTKHLHSPRRSLKSVAKAK